LRRTQTQRHLRVFYITQRFTHAAH
jgi:hypothetical protein